MATGYNPEKNANLSTAQKGAIAEFACIYRMQQYGLLPFLPLSPGGRVDLVAYNPKSETFWRIQVKTAGANSKGSGIAHLRVKSGKGRIRYEQNAFDILIAYEPCTEICYIFSAAEIANNNFVIAVRPDAAEAWHKLT